MKTNLILAGTLVLGLAGTGCATKKYVAKSVADAVNPVQARVGETESKNGQQDVKLNEQGQQIETIETNLSRTNERLTTADSKATAAGQAAAAADSKATQADSKAVAAQTAAENARTLAQRGLTRADEVETKLMAANRYQLVASETVLFDLNSSKLTEESKTKLADIAKRTGEHSRFIVEIQGFTDKTGSPEANEVLSDRRADAVTRFLINEHQVPLRNVTTIGSGYAMPVGDDKTRDGRKMNRRVEVRLFVPEVAGTSAVASND